MIFAKRLIRRSLHRLGWELSRFDCFSSPSLQLVRQLRTHEITVVLDIGANVGQFGERLRDAGFPGRIISFEASAEAHRCLRWRANGDSSWIIAPRMAIGQQDGTATLHLSANSVSSSLLPMLPAHVAVEPTSIYVSSESVEMRRLDSVASEFLSQSDRVFLKSDVQGLELQVLRGAAGLLESTIGVQMELSLTPLYEGEHLFDVMFHELEDRGFTLWSLVPGLLDRDTGRLLQVDGIFFRS